MADLDVRSQTAAIKELTRAFHKLTKVCEALNENLVIIGRDMKKDADGTQS